MSMWYTVFWLQAAIFVACTLVGTILLGMRKREALLACALVCPAPLFQVAGGAGSWIFAADVAAICMAIHSLFARNQNSKARGMVILAAAILFLPTISTVLGMGWNPQPRLWNFVAVQVARSIGYFVVFSSLAGGRVAITRPDRFLMLQCLFFGLICCCGLFQYATGFDLDLWNLAIRSNPTEGNWGFGGGFMGLYRGAVGGWAIAFLGVLPIVFMPRAGWSLLLPALISVVFAAMLATGSRQGFAIGSLALIYGVYLALTLTAKERRFAALLQSGVAVVGIVLVGLVAFNRLSGTRFEEWISRRYAQFGELSSITDVGNLALSRGARIGPAWENLSSHPAVMAIGLGFGVEQIGSVAGGTAIILLDSELFFVWQLGGLLLLGLYLFFLVRLRWKLRLGRQQQELPTKITLAAARVTLVGGVLLLWGHFFLLNFHSNQAPVAYWCWSLFGIALASSSSQPSAEYSAEESLMLAGAY